MLLPSVASALPHGIHQPPSPLPSLVFSSPARPFRSLGRDSPSPASAREACGGGKTNSS